MFTVKECRAITVGDVLVPANSGRVLWGPPGLLRRPDGSLGIVSTTAHWLRKDPPATPPEAICTVNLTTVSATGAFKADLTPWTQELVVVALPCAGRLLCGPPQRGRLVAANSRYDRWYFLCPRCGRRYRTLYLPLPAARLWACRRCWRVGYPCQYRSRKRLLLGLPPRRKRKPISEESLSEHASRIVKGRAVRGG